MLSRTLVVDPPSTSSKSLGVAPWVSRRRGRRTGGKPTYCVLDCVLVDTTHTFYVLDILCWAGVPLQDCTAECRYFLLRSKLAEVEAERRPDQPPFPCKFQTLDVLPCDAAGLATLAQTEWPYPVAGALLQHKEAPYLPGPTPTLLWVPVGDIVPRLVAPALDGMNANGADAAMDGA